MTHKKVTWKSFAVASALLLPFGVGLAMGETGSGGGLTIEEAVASGQCEVGDLQCLDEILSDSADGSLGDKGSRDDGKSDDKSSEDDDSESRDGKSDDKSSEDDDSESRDGKSDDKSSEDDDSESRDGKSDDKSSEDDDSESRDGKSDDKSSEDDDSESRDGKSDDKSSKDDDSKSDDDSSGDDGSRDEDSDSDDDSSSDDGPVNLPGLSIGNNEGVEFNNITLVPVDLNIVLDAVSTEPAVVNWATENGTAEAGTDFVAANGQVIIPPGEQSAMITVFITGDDISEPLETFFVRLSMPSGARLVDDLGEVLISDDDDIDD